MDKKLPHDLTGSPVEKVTELFFSFQNRINRKQFISRYLLALIIFSFIAFAIKSLLGESEAANLLQILPVAFLVWATFSICIRRLHDANLSSWWVLAPIVREIFGLLIKSTPGQNSYGVAPDPKRWY